MKELIVVGSHKGGVGKTTHVANLGCALATQDRPVLLVDLDPQGNLAESFGLISWRGVSLEDLLLGDPDVAFDDVIQTVGDNLFLLPNRGELANFDEFIDPFRATDNYIDSLLSVVEEFVGEDAYVIFDTPPGTSLVSDLAFATARWVLVAAEAKPYEVMAAEKIYDKLEPLTSQPGADSLEILGIVNTRTRQTGVRRVPKIYRRAREAIQASDDMELFEVEIPENLAVAEAIESGKPLVLLKPDHKASRKYFQLASSIASKIDSRKAVAA